MQTVFWTIKWFSKNSRWLKYFVKENYFLFGCYCFDCHPYITAKMFEEFIHMPNPRMQCCSILLEVFALDWIQSHHRQKAGIIFSIGVLGPQNVPHLFTLLFLILRRLVNDTGIFYEICMFCKWRDIYEFMSFYMLFAENISSFNHCNDHLHSFLRSFLFHGLLTSSNYWKQLVMKKYSLCNGL